MAMCMLEAGGLPVMTDEIRKPDIDNPGGYYEFEPVKKTKSDSSWLKAASGHAVKLVYKLLYDLPDGYQYRVLFMNRRFSEVLSSQDAMLARTGTQVAPMDETRFVELFRAECDRAKTWLTEQTHFAHLDVDYNRILERPQAQITAIDSFLGGGLDTAAMCQIVEPSLYRQRR
jgi:hypothetical protein